MWLNVFEPGSSPRRLMFRYDPARDVIEIQRRGEKHLFDLAHLREEHRQLMNNSGNVYIPRFDVYRTGPDGQRKLVAESGKPIPWDQAVRLGLVKDTSDARIGPSQHK